MLQQLGVNDTVFLQFVIYIISFPLLHHFVFKPFSLVHEERQNRTKGSEQLSYEYQQKAVELQASYQQKVREVNQSIQEIFNRAKAEAIEDQDKIINTARAAAQVKMDENNKKLSSMISSVSEDLRKETSQLTLAVTQKLLGKG